MARADFNKDVPKKTALLVVRVIAHSFRDDIRSLIL